MNAPPERVLIVRLSSIGDVVHTLPAYMALRRAWPDTRFGWAVETAAADLLSHLDGLEVHRLRVQDWRRRLARPSTWRAIRAARATMRERGYSLAIDFQGLLKSALVARAGGAPVLGFDRADCRERAAAWAYRRSAAPVAGEPHIVYRNLHLAAAATGVESNGVEWPRIASERDAQRVDETLTKLRVESPILIHAAANWDSKRLPPECYVEAGRLLHEQTGRPILWVWGPGERDLVHSLATRAGEGNRPAFATRLPELAALLARSALLIGGDSAPLHLAVACGTPTVAVFGPTDPARTGPLDIRDGVVVRRLECSHCHRRRCPLGTNECLESISAEEIVEAALRRLDAS